MECRMPNTKYIRTLLHICFTSFTSLIIMIIFHLWADRTPTTYGCELILGKRNENDLHIIIIVVLTNFDGCDVNVVIVHFFSANVFAAFNCMHAMQHAFYTQISFAESTICCFFLLLFKNAHAKYYLQI